MRNRGSIRRRRGRQSPRTRALAEASRLPALAWRRRRSGRATDLPSARGGTLLDRAVDAGVVSPPAVLEVTLSVEQAEVSRVHAHAGAIFKLHRGARARDGVRVSRGLEVWVECGRAPASFSSTDAPRPNTNRTTEHRPCHSVTTCRPAARRQASRQLVKHARSLVREIDSGPNPNWASKFFFAQNFIFLAKSAE